MAFLAKLYDNARVAERQALDADATLRGEDYAPVDVLVADLSATGCLFICATPIEPDARITIGVAGVGQREARIVRVMGSRYGCAFTTALTDVEMASVRTDPGDAVVAFPSWSSTASSDETDLLDVTKLPGSLRLAVLAGATTVGWSAVIAVMIWLR